MNYLPKQLLIVVLRSLIFLGALNSSALAQLQQGSPTQINPNNRLVEKDSFGRPIKNVNDPKKDDKNSSVKKDPKDLKKNTDPGKKQDSLKEDFSSGVRCFNCGTILSVTESRKKTKPVWMSTTDPTDPTNAEQASKNAERNAERIESRSSEEFQKSSSNQVKMGGTLTRPNTEVTLQRKLGFETIVKMDDGTIKTVVTALQPAYNIGAKVRVIGNTLNPR